MNKITLTAALILGLSASAGSSYAQDKPIPDKTSQVRTDSSTRKGVAKRPVDRRSHAYVAQEDVQLGRPGVTPFVPDGPGRDPNWHDRNPGVNNGTTGNGTVVPPGTSNGNTTNPGYIVPPTTSNGNPGAGNTVPGANNGTTGSGSTAAPGAGNGTTGSGSTATPGAGNGTTGAGAAPGAGGSPSSNVGSSPSSNVGSSR